MKAFGFAVLIVLMAATGAGAESPYLGDPAIRISGKADAIVTEPTIRLTDIAQITSPRIQDDSSVVDLRKLVVAESPKAGESKVINAADILDRLRSGGVRLDQVRYTFPREITVTRAYREISTSELEQAVSTFLQSGNHNIDVRQLMVEKPVRVPVDAYGVSVVDLRVTQPGHIGLDFRAASPTEDARFQLKALADEWRMIPVATRPIRKGSIVSASDVELQRLNATQIGRDSVESIGDLVGREVSRDVGQGEFFRSNIVTIPPVIVTGSRVTLMFRQGGLEATATGIALESGVTGQEIKVRNENSKRTVSGRILETGLVTVGE